jgi:hypothetical protein
VKCRPEGPFQELFRGKTMTQQKIRTCLWFDENAEEAAAFYVWVAAVR